jgi:hypothetical protein
MRTTTARMMITTMRTRPTMQRRTEKGRMADGSNEEEDEVNNPSLSPNRHDEEEQEEEEDQSTPKTSKVNVVPNAADAPKTSRDDDDPMPLMPPLSVEGRVLTK